MRPGEASLPGLLVKTDGGGLSLPRVPRPPPSEKIALPCKPQPGSERPSTSPEVITPACRCRRLWTRPSGRPGEGLYGSLAICSRARANRYLNVCLGGPRGTPAGSSTRLRAVSGGIRPSPRCGLGTVSTSEQPARDLKRLFAGPGAKDGRPFCPVQAGRTPELQSPEAEAQCHLVKGTEKVFPPPLSLWI